MDLSELRVIGSIALLLGLTFFTIGLYTGQLNRVAEILKEIFKTAVAGAA